MFLRSLKILQTARMCCFIFWKKISSFFSFVYTKWKVSWMDLFFHAFGIVESTCLCWDFRKFYKMYILRKNMSQYEEIYYCLFILFTVWVVLLNIMEIFICAVQNLDRHHDIETCNLTLVFWMHLSCFICSSRLLLQFCLIWKLSWRSGVWVSQDTSAHLFTSLSCCL